MKRFAKLFAELDQTNKTNEKILALKEYFAEAPDADKMWAAALFTGRRPKRQVNRTQLWGWASELTDLPEWLFRESYHAVGDLAETIALLLPDPQHESDRSLSEWIEYLNQAARESESEKQQKITAAWNELGQQERFVFNKLITGAFRVGVSQNLLIRAIAGLHEIEKTILAHRFMGNWDPASTTYQQLVFEENRSDDLSRPYPFFLAHPIDGHPQELGVPAEWQAEWKWDGIRSQTLLRKGQFFIWSRGEELVTEKFPELRILQTSLPDGVAIDGEIMPYKDGQVLPFNVLQTRIGRKNLSAAILKNAPVALFAYDLLEWRGEDIREQPLRERRELLGKLVEEVNRPNVLRLSPAVAFATWEELAEKRETSRQHFAEGLMLKHKDSLYQVGRKRGDWWKWKVEPLTIDGVLIYAQKGSGRRASLFTDYTFGVWNGEVLVPFAKAYSGLTDKEIRQVDDFIRKNTVEKFGPVRTVHPELVFEIGFEGIQESKRHKSGVALRFPRMLRWRTDKKAADANSLDELKEILKAYQAGTT
ncbi:MAG: ATP-dependent DNA ligase [Bacteroidia bacterium]